jgi:predicted phage terminase large subunit-like protein
MMLFRVRDFCLLVSDTEAQAVEFLGDIKVELEDNEPLRQTFGIKKVLKSTETNVIVQFSDGEMFRITVKGSEQKVRGLKWRNRRPNLIVGDDLENDEIVMNPERREKFRKWFMKALVPCGSDDCMIRIVGTVLHLDSMLQRLLDNKTWSHLFFQAHNPDFSEILWPEQFPRTRLEAIRADYEEEGDLDGYAQEYLNRPIAEGNTYFRKDDFLDFIRDDSGPLIPPLVYYAAADFAISEKEKADYTAIMVAGMDPDGFLWVSDLRYGRWDSEQIIEELIAVQKAYTPEVFTFETEKIDKALGPFLERRMRQTGIYLNINKETPTKSKTQRGRSIQGMVKSRSVRFDKQASWYPELEGQLLTISDSGPRGKHDDYFDAFAYIGLTLDKYWEASTPQEEQDWQDESDWEDFHSMGRNGTTGY